MKNKYVDTGDRIKQLRLDHKMTQTDLANELGVSKSIISAYEKDLRKPSFKILKKLAAIFNVSIQSFIVDENIDQKFSRSLDVGNLTSEQINILKSLIREFEKKNYYENND